MRDFLKSWRFKILVGILTLMLGFMIAAVYSGGSAELFSQAISFVTVPVQRFSAGVTGSISGFFDQYLNTARTYEENAALREQIAELRRQLVDYEKIKHEYEQFQKISDMRQQQTDQTFAIASVIDRDYSNPYAGFTIDKGRLDDVAVHDPVITAEGLVGYVTEVSLTSSKVMTLLSVNMNVGASNSSTRDIGNVTGTVDLALRGLCRLEYLPRESATAVGDVIATSGGGLFPKGLIIGTVTEVGTSSGGNSLEAVLRPAAEIGNVKDVFVITDFEGQGSE